MIIEHLFISKDSSIDQERNTLSIFDIIEDLTIQNEDINAAAAIPLTLIGVLKRTDETGPLDFEVELKISKPSKEPIFFKFPIQMLAEHRRYRLRVNFAIELSPGSGDYFFCLSKADDPQVSRVVDARITRIQVARSENKQ